MPHSTGFKNNLVKHIFQNANIALVGDATGLRGSTTAGSLYISFHTADPSAGNQTTSEANYTAYGRIAVTRDSAWTDTGGKISNANVITFAKCLGGSNLITYVGIGTALSGAGSLLYAIPLGGNSFTVSNGITPEFDIGQLYEQYN